MGSLVISDKARNIISHNSYASLPKYKKVDQKKEILKKIAFILKDLTLIGPAAQLILTLSIAPLFRWSIREHCTSQMTDAKAALAKRIEQLAQKAGIVNYQRFKVCIGDPFSSPAALLSRTIILPPEDLLKPEDLPKELKLELLDQGKMSEDEWIAHFVIWHYETYSNRKRKVFHSQYEVDRRYIFGKEILKKLRNPKERWKEFDAIVGHELGHCQLNHTKKHVSLNFGLQLLAWPTFGLYKLFQNKILEKVSRKNEREADFFSVRKVNGGAGLILCFSNYSNILKPLHSKYPERINALGDNLRDKDHPPLSERIKYLQAANV